MSKPQRFEIGQAVPFVSAKLMATNGLFKVPFNGKNEIYHVAVYVNYGPGVGFSKPTWWLRLKELPYYIDECTLEPVELTSEELEAVVNEALTQPIEV